MSRRYRMFDKLAAVFIVLFFATTMWADKLRIGDKAPEWSDVIGVDDAKHSLDDYKAAKLLVIVFTCNHCPVATDYEGRIIDLQKAYRNRGAQVIAINVSNLPADRLDKMKKRAAARNFGFPYLYDSSQKLGHEYGATVTPHVFVLDENRNVAYVGAFDDSRKEAEVSTPFLRNALDALLRGDKPPQEVTRPFGCGILYE